MRTLTQGLQETYDVCQRSGPRPSLSSLECRPSLASNAAVELDLLINDEPTGLDAVRQLGERLRTALDKPIPDQPARGLHVDTETETVLAKPSYRRETPIRRRSSVS